MASQPYTPPRVKQHGRQVACSSYAAVELTQQQCIKKYRRRFMYLLALREQSVNKNHPQINSRLSFFLHGLNGLGGNW